MQTTLLASKSTTQTREIILEKLNRGFNELKIEFHKTGRFDDANAKLDEILKMLVIKHFDLKSGSGFTTTSSLQRKGIARLMQKYFVEISKEPLFQNQDGTNVFGTNPHLNIQENDEFVRRIMSLINSLQLETLWNSSFDILNEAFGHFIRVSFRNHKEDAQYMTPIEVVDLMSEMAMQDLESDLMTSGSLTVMDPTCGVGTFLTAFAQKAKGSSRLPRDQKFVGQDKVDRMVRMAKINALYAGIDPNLIKQGNSILGTSFIDSFVGKVDLILTNPPFGADFFVSELNLEDYGLTQELSSHLPYYAKTLPSELLLIDRALRLLKDGGRLLIVVPDSVVSAKGAYEEYRNIIQKSYLLRAIIDLPAVTFAQAGTRTRCSIVYIQKAKPQTNRLIFFGVAKEIGFEVKERMGSPIKVTEGTNELIDLVGAYRQLQTISETQVLSDPPSAVAMFSSQLINGKWNANFYNADRVNAIRSLDALSSQFEVVSLGEVVDFVGKQRDKLEVSKEIKQISILHINKDMTVSLDEIENYFPKGTGLACMSGELLLSKINPRIPRIAVVPNHKKTLTCSPEFEILKPKNGMEVYLLQLLLLSPFVQNQILSLTSGTSSSHNRIKLSELREIRIPLPKKGSEVEARCLELAKLLRVHEGQKYEANRITYQSMREIGTLFK